MTSSGIKRGVATFAISALAVAGLPLLAGSASAEPNAAQYADDTVELLSQHTGVASVKNDGTNTTVRLEAGAASDVSSVTFQYRIANGTPENPWIDVATVSRNDDGAFSTEWDAVSLVGATVDIRVVSSNPTTADPDDTDQRDDVVVVGGGATQHAVNLSAGPAAGLGYWASPYTSGPTGTYVGMTGTTSATSGTVQLQRFVGGTGEPTDFETAAVAANGTFAGIHDLEAATAYNFVGSPDEVTLGVERDSDDVEAFTLYAQQIGTVTASPTAVGQPGGSGDATITVTVVDQNGNPIANAEVRPSNGGVVTDPDVKYTDAKGQVTFPQSSGTTYYYANQTDGDAYEPTVGDKRSEDVTVTPYTPVATSLVATSRDGAAFDFDENTNGVGGDIQVQVKDQQGNNKNSDGQTLQYYWVITPFDGSAAVRVPGTSTTPAAETGTGTYDIVFPAGPEGTYELFASLNEVPISGGQSIAESKVLTVKAGESQVAYDEMSPESTLAGGTEAVTGKLVLDDGTGLGGRDLAFSLDAPDAGENAEIRETSGTANDGIVTTGADGSFTFNVVDQVQSPQPTERRTISVGPDAATVDNDTVGGDIGPDNQEVVFAADAAPAGSTITITPDTTTDNPGEVQQVTVNVDGPDAGTAPDVANTEVDLTVDEGYFTNAAGTADLGKSITVVTNDSGVATAYITIKRNAGFDDDGDVNSIVTATSGAASDTEDYAWTTDGTTEGTVDLVFSNSQTVGVLPKAPWETENVFFEVIALDKFGNRVGGVSVDVEGAFVNAANTATTTTVSSDFSLTDRDVTASQSAAGMQEYTAVWNDSIDPPTGPNLDSEDSESIDWYDLQVTTVTLTASGTNPHPIGSTVTMTYKAVDQNGEPVAGYFVDFFRAGPDDEGDGEENDFNATNQMGEAYYVFQGENAGTATVSTVLYDTFGTLVPAGQATEEVTFAGTTGCGEGGNERCPIEPKLRGRDNGAAADRLTVKGPRIAAGASVELFKIRKDGKRVFIKEKTLNRDGDVRFKVGDKNGNKITTYKAVVKRTVDTKRGSTNRKDVR